MVSCRSTALLLSAALAALTSTTTLVSATSTQDLDFSNVNLANETLTVGKARAADDGDDTSDQTVQITFQHVQPKIRNGELKSRGVNLGGWLVAENWMTKDADFWRGVNDKDANGGEYTAITKAASSDTVRSNLDYHHAHFITEDEIRAIAEAGFNTVRVPVGYWIVGFDNNDPSGNEEWRAFSSGTIKYLDLLIQNWAKKHNIAVLISIHAAKGSQNGADHSSPSVPGQSYWSEFSENVDNTWSISTFLASRYKDETAFLGIGLLNEPNGSTKEDVLYQHYQDVYKAIRDTGNDCVLTVAPLLWKQGPNSMVGFMEAPAFKNVWVEWHPYFVWGYEQTSESDLINVSVKQNLQGDFTKWNTRDSHNRLFVGEWSFATAGKFGNNQEQYYEFAQAQLNVLNQAQGGWTFWSWRIYGDENGFNGWSLRSVLRDARFKQMLQASNAQ